MEAERKERTLFSRPYAKHPTTSLEFRSGGRRNRVKKSSLRALLRSLRSLLRHASCIPRALELFISTTVSDFFNGYFAALPPNTPAGDRIAAPLRLLAQEFLGLEKSDGGFLEDSHTNPLIWKHI